MTNLDAIEKVPAKTIVTRTKSVEWFGAEYNMNIYRGCCHGCIYCDSRSLCYRNYDFGRVKVKEDALRVIRDDLKSRRRRGVVATGAMSDPYNPLERELLISRHALELLHAFGFGVAIATKSTLVVRDIDLLQDIGRRHRALVKMTITAADDGLCRRIEPFVSPSSERFEALRKVAEGGVFCGVLMMPILPFIGDSKENVAEIVEKAADCGARFIYASFGLSMRDGQREYLYAALDRHFPGLSRKYAERYGSRYQCPSPNARKLWDVFRTACVRRGVLYNMADIVTASRHEGEMPQRELF